MGQDHWRAFTALLVVVVVVAVAGGIGAATLLDNRPPPAASPSGSSLAVQPSPSAPAGPNAGSDTTPTTSPSASPWTDPTASPPPPRKVPPPTSAPPNQLTGYEWPLRHAYISSRFGPRDFGGFVVIDGKEVHDGLDLVTRCNDKVRAAHDGTVLYAGRKFDAFIGYLGNPERIYSRLEQQGRLNTLPIVVVIDDGNGYRSIYVHLNKALVEAGNVVKAGEVIGQEGATGYATGCHLHYGLIRMDGAWQPVVSNLHPYGYPPMVRERVNPIRIFAWDDEFAPRALQQRVSPSPSADPTAGPSSSPVASPGPAASPTPSATNSPLPSGIGQPSPRPSGAVN